MYDDLARFISRQTWNEKIFVKREAKNKTKQNKTI